MAIIIQGNWQPNPTTIASPNRRRPRLPRHEWAQVRNSLTRIGARRLNIFVLDRDPKLAAQYACDMHVSKMVVETAQILSTVVKKYIPSGPYITQEVLSLIDPNRRVHAENNYGITACEFESRFNINLTPASYYKSTHANHPSVLWASFSLANYTWLYQYFIELATEYERRYGKVHLTRTKLAELLAPSNVENLLLFYPNKAKDDPLRNTSLINEISSFRNRTITTPRLVTTPDMLRYVYGGNVAVDRAGNQFSPNVLTESEAGQYRIYEAGPLRTNSPTIGSTGPWDDVINAYRIYYCIDKFKIGKWTNAPIPDWYHMFHSEKGAELVKTEKRINKQRTNVIHTMQYEDIPTFSYPKIHPSRLIPGDQLHRPDPFTLQDTMEPFRRIDMATVSTIAPIHVGTATTNATFPFTITFT